MFDGDYGDVVIATRNNDGDSRTTDGWARYANKVIIGFSLVGIGIGLTAIIGILSEGYRYAALIGLAFLVMRFCPRKLTFSRTPKGKPMTDNDREKVNRRLDLIRTNRMF